MAVTTKCDRYYKVWEKIITKCDWYYKVWEQVITKCDGYYHVQQFFLRRNSCRLCDIIIEKKSFDVDLKERYNIKPSVACI